jgi:SPW repeat
MGLSRRRFGGVNFATSANLLAGIWLIASPWIFGAPAVDAGAWGSVLAGAAIALVAVLRSTAGPPGATLSWFNVLLGASMTASPWIFAYVDQSARAWNSAVVGVLVVILACIAETAPEAWGSPDNDYRPAPGWDYPYSVPAEHPGEPAIWYEAADYGRAGLGEPERADAPWSSSWRRRR